MIEEILQKIGLIPSETKLYLALLELGPQGANMLARKTGIKRANVYYFLEGLKEKGLVSQFSDMSGIRYFRAESPDKLLQVLETQKKDLEKKENEVSVILPELKALIAKHPVMHPKIRFYETKKAVKQLYDQVFSCKQIYAIANIDAVGAIFPEYTWGLPKLVLKKKINMQELIVNTKSAKKYAQGVYKKLHKVKILPKKYQFETDILIYDKKVAFISYRKVITACLIEDNLIYQAHKNIFEGLWGKI